MPRYLLGGDDVEREVHRIRRERRVQLQLRQGPLARALVVPVVAVGDDVARLIWAVPDAAPICVPSAVILRRACVELERMQMRATHLPERLRNTLYGTCGVAERVREVQKIALSVVQGAPAKPTDTRK